MTIFPYISAAITRRNDWIARGVAKVRAPDLQIEAWLYELEISILAHNLDVGDLEHDCYVAAKCEYELNPSPNMDYVRRLCAEALSKPFETRH